MVKKSHLDTDEVYAEKTKVKVFVDQQNSKSQYKTLIKNVFVFNFAPEMLMRLFQ